VQVSFEVATKDDSGLASAVKPQRLEEITRRYGGLRIAVVGDLCLDRYFEIDPKKQETSIETNLPVHNVTRVRCQAGAAGTIINNLAALGVGAIYPVAIVGEDGEGFELKRALSAQPGVDLRGIVEAPQRRTFTYTKPLVVESGKAPVELNRLDIKNWTPTPEVLQGQVADLVQELASRVDAIIVMDQVDIAETGVVTKRVLQAIGEIAKRNPELLILADSRRSLRGFPKVSLKMNAAEFENLTGSGGEVNEIVEKAVELASRFGKHVFITMAERGIIGASGGVVERVQAVPVRGEIDIVGAGDSVTANIVAGLAGGGTTREVLELAQLAASIVIHQLGTTGTASVKQIAELLVNSPYLEE
jgi:rfaE bifunctional protein kinase chain/domain